MARIEQNEHFLENLINSSAKKRVKLITDASEEEIKVLFEILINSKTLPYTNKEDKIVKKHKILNSFLGKHWEIKSLRKFFIKNFTSCVSLFILVLNKILEGSVCGVLNNGD
jgi:uncharacterized membrane protein YheB (UPF0754 family)